MNEVVVEVAKNHQNAWETDGLVILENLNGTASVNNRKTGRLEKTSHKRERVKQSLQRRCGVRQTVRLYGFEDLDLVTLLGDDAPKAAHFIHTIYTRRVLERRKRDEPVPLNESNLNCRYAGFRRILDRLMQAGIVERRESYCPGHRSMGYRFGPDYRNRTLRLLDIEHDGEFVNRIAQIRGSFLSKPIDEHLHNCLSQFLPNLELAESRFGDWGGFETARELLCLMADGQWNWSICEYGRRHSVLTRTPKLLRSVLRADGEELCEIDITSSQWVFLLVLLRKRGVACEEFEEIILSGQFYETLASEAALADRESAKSESFKALYGKNGYSSKTKSYLEKNFPAVMAEIARQKKKDYRHLAQNMQREESRFVIHTVCDRFRKERTDMPVATIHDSILGPASEQNYLLQVMTDEFEELGLTPAIKTHIYDDHWWGSVLEEASDGRRQKVLVRENSLENQLHA